MISVMNWKGLTLRTAYVFSFACITHLGCASYHSYQMESSIEKQIFPFSRGNIDNSEADKRNQARSEIKYMTAHDGTIEPVRGEVPDDIVWRYGSRPDYTLTNVAYLKGKTKNHPTDSIELLVENMVKRWEMEGSHFLDYNQWSTINQAKYTTQANGGKIFRGSESKDIGNYNLSLIHI